MTIPASETVILVTRNGMGAGDQALQHKLLLKYLTLLVESGILTAAICLYADGVKLAVSGSPVLEGLHDLEQKGVRIILCSTCLEHYNLADQVLVGVVGSMADIIEAQFRAEKVISI